MASARAKPYLLPEEYLDLERNADRKSDYHAGQLFALAGASKAHNRIVSNLLRHLGNQLSDTPCFPYPSDMRVQVERSGPYVYPDVVVTCGDEKYLDDHSDTLLNPFVIVEVLSKSSEDYDRGKKFMLYRQISSLTSYVVVAQSRPIVELWERQTNNRWLLTESNGLDATLNIASLQAQLLLSDIYNRVAFPKGDPTNTY